MYQLIVRRLLLSVVIYLYVECVIADATKRVARFEDTRENIVNEFQLWNHANTQRILSDAYKISVISPTTIRNDEIVNVIFE
jgi:hypothetical protein